MEENEMSLPRPLEREVQIILAESICVMLILLSVLLIKFCFADLYQNIGAWYVNHLCAETELSDVLELPEAGVDAV